MQYIGENYLSHRGTEKRFCSPKPVTVPAETFITKKHHWCKVKRNMARRENVNISTDFVRNNTFGFKVTIIKMVRTSEVISDIYSMQNLFTVPASFQNIIVFLVQFTIFYGR